MNELLKAKHKHLHHEAVGAASWFMIMARTKEFIKESEARILIFLQNAANYMKKGSRMSEKLGIDYVYIMKILEQMYEKGWIRCHKYNLTTYFDLTKVSPMKEAVKRIAKPQVKLGAL